jgi:hypothetical protein
VPDQDRSETRVEVVLGEGQRFVDPQPRAPEQHDQGPMRAPWLSSPAARMTVTISSTVGGSGGSAARCCAAGGRRDSPAG